MKHYICTGGCRGVSEVPGVCNTPDCSKHKHALVECPCQDGKHFDFKACVNCDKLCEGKCDIEPFHEELKA